MEAIIKKLKHVKKGLKTFQYHKLNPKYAEKIQELESVINELEALNYLVFVPNNSIVLESKLNYLD